LMRKALETFAEAAAENDPIGRLSATGRFFGVLLAECGNEVIREILDGLNARINFLRAQSMSKPERARYSLAEMRRILSAVQKGDEDAARKAATDHVKSACNAAQSVYVSRQTNRRSRCLIPITK